MKIIRENSIKYIVFWNYQVMSITLGIYILCIGYRYLWSLITFFYKFHFFFLNKYRSCIPTLKKKKEHFY